MDADYFYYYGQVELRAEIEADLLTGIIQDRRSLYYYREYGAGAAEQENLPIASAMESILKYEIASWVARRNADVTNGSAGTRDRRAVTSQSSISIQRGNGEVTVSVPYIPLFDYERPSVVTIPA